MRVDIMSQWCVALLAVLGFASVLPIADSYGLTKVASTNASASPAGKFTVVAANLARDGLSGDPAPDAPLAYPNGTRTGLPAIDSVLAALDSPLPDTLQALFVETPSPCVVTPQGITNPPRCPPDTPAGTLVPTFRATACESVWPDYLPTILGNLWKEPHPVLAIYRNPSDAYGWLPAADFAILVESGSPGYGFAAMVRVSDDGVNGIGFGCGHLLSQLIDGVVPERFVLPPLERLPVAAAAPEEPQDVRAGLIVCITTPCPGYYVEWTDSSVEENGFLIYWRETICADQRRPPAVIASAPRNSNRRDELPILFRPGCQGEVGVASYNGVGFSTVSWAPLR